jgi:uncharacterized protein YggE
MVLRQFAYLQLISAVPLLAQISNNTVTVTASQSSRAQPEAVFSVAVTSLIDTSLDQVVAAVSGLGITAGNLVEISNANVLVAFSPTPAPPGPAAAVPLNWVFQLVVPFSKLKDTTAALAAFEKSISQNNSGLTVSFRLSGTQVSRQQAPACNLANLVAQARSQAQDIAGAAGFKAGAVVGLTSSTSNGAPVVCSLTARFTLGVMFGQPEPVITITATRTNTIQPDQVLIGLSVQSPTTAGLDDITGALTGAGIAGATFTGVTTFYTSTGIQTQTELVWSFTLTAALAKLSATLDPLVSAQQTISGNNSGLTLTFYIRGIEISPQFEQSQNCSEAALLADAQTQAKAVAAGAGVSVGSILSITEGSNGSLNVAPVPSAAFLAGDFTSVIFDPNVGYPLNNSVLSTPQATCSLTVRFQLM